MSAREERIAYVMSRFPKVTETFVLREILEVRRHGAEVSLFPLILEKSGVEQPEVAELRPVTDDAPLFSLGMIPAHLRRAVKSPWRYVRTAARVLVSHRGSRRAFTGALATFPKAVAMAEKIERSGATRIHAHFANNPALAAWIVHELTGIPFSFTAHGSDIHRDQSGLRQKVAASDFTVMISEYNRRFVAERCGEDLLPKMTVVHCGIDGDAFSPGEPEERSTFEILCVAALRAVKGHKTLIDACAQLRDAGVDFRCTLIGEGPLRETLEAQLAEKGLEDQVLLEGAKPGPVVRDRMRTADVVVLPSIQDAQGRREGIPVTLMEAMSCETPVVSSRISGIPELVEDGRSGLLTEPGDADQLAEALLRLQGDPELRRELGVRGREKVRSEFILSDCVSQLVSTWVQRRGTSAEPTTALSGKPLPAR